jgi:hypothetical protein
MTTVATATYNATNHARWRFRHATNTVFFEVATVAGSFSSLGSIASWTGTGHTTARLNTMHASFWSGNWNSTAGRPDLVIDQVN